MTILIQVTSIQQNFPSCPIELICRKWQRKKGLAWAQLPMWQLYLCNSMSRSWYKCQFSVITNASFITLMCKSLNFVWILQGVHCIVSLITRNVTVVQHFNITIMLQNNDFGPWKTWGKDNIFCQIKDKVLN